MLQQAINKVFIEGILSETNLDYKSYMKDGKTMEAIAGTVTVLVEKEVNGVPESYQIEVHYFNNRYTKQGKENPSYNDLLRVKNEFKSIASCGSRDLSSYEKLFEGVDSIRNMLDGGEESVVSLLKKIRRESQNISSLDKSLSALDSRLESSFYELNDISEEFGNYANKLVYDPSHLQEVQERLSLIYNLKKKYASSQSAPLKEVFDYYENAQKSLEQLGAGSENKAELQKSVSV